MNDPGNAIAYTLDDLAIQRARRNYIKYCEMAYHGQWEAGRHHVLIANKLQGVLDGKIKRLMFWLPPRHGKSMEVTETFPSRYLGQFPDKRVLEVSYGDELAQKFGLSNRNKVNEFGEPLFGIRVSSTQATKTNWGIEGHRGGMLSVGVGGSITGEGADLLILDDPIKNREEAESETFRKKLINEWQSTIYTRLHANGAIIIILTRWHENDLANMLLHPDNGTPEPWEVVSLPCECDSEDDLLGRKIGEPLWPEHGYDKEWMRTTRIAVGEYAWFSLYQQKPHPDSGAIIKREWLSKRYTKMPDGATVVQSWDLPFVKSEESAKCAGFVVGRVGANIYVEDCVNDKMEFTETVTAVRDMSAKHPEARAKVIEAAANGHALIDYLNTEISGLVPYKPVVGKEERTRATTPYYEAGNVYFKQDSPWVSGVIEDLVSFPNGKYKDTVDALTQAILYLESVMGGYGGMIYRLYAENRAKYKLTRSEMVKRVCEGRNAFTGEMLSVGISLGSTSRGVSFVATAITSGYKEVLVLASKHCNAHATPVEIAQEFVGFVQWIKATYCEAPSYAYCDGSESVIYRTIKDAAQDKLGSVNLRRDAKSNENDRINLTQRLIEQGRLFISEDCDDISRAFVEARWDGKKEKPTRQDSDIADTALLKAMEYTFERQIRTLTSE